jgi:hypothetical protein
VLDELPDAGFALAGWLDELSLDDDVVEAAGWLAGVSLPVLVDPLLPDELAVAAALPEDELEAAGGLGAGAATGAGAGAATGADAATGIGAFIVTNCTTLETTLLTFWMTISAEAFAGLWANI